MKTPGEFFLVISPSQTIMDYVSYLKREIKKIVGHNYPSAFAKAHISLFKYPDHHTESFLYQVDSEVSRQKAFHVHVRDLGVFKHGANGTIYLNIEHKSPICDLVELWTRKTINPHITIARNLEPNDFIKAREIVKDISYENDFICDRITVLKKTRGYWYSYLELPFHK